MFDAAIMSLAGAAITITTIVIGFLTLWVKLKYGIEEKADKAVVIAEKSATNIETKIDTQTAISSRIEEQTNGALERKLSHIESHASRIEDNSTRVAALEAKTEGIRVALDALVGNVNSTRHELRGHMQTITNTLNILSLKITPPKE